MDAVRQPSPSTIQVISHPQYDAEDSLSPSTVPSDPLELFRKWFTEAQANPTLVDPEAMAISTATAQGRPSTRFVLLKQLDARGVVFFTNYTSRKSREIQENPWASLAIYWAPVHRQVRVVGKVEKLEKEESDKYFRTRPVGSRVGAWASPQSAAVKDGELAERVRAVEERFAAEGGKDADIPLPSFWGGWRVVPVCVITNICLLQSLIHFKTGRSSSGLESPRDCMIE